MLTRMLSLLCLLLSGAVQAFEFPIEVIEYIDNTKVVAFINEDDIDKTLEWQPFASSPPLAVGAALKALQQDIATELGTADVRLTGIELKRIPHHENHWHYLVKMRVTVNEDTHSRYFVVLMNGKVVPALKEPETVK